MGTTSLGNTAWLVHNRNDGTSAFFCVRKTNWCKTRVICFGEGVTVKGLILKKPRTTPSVNTVHVSTER